MPRVKCVNEHLATEYGDCMYCDQYAFVPEDTALCWNKRCRANVIRVQMTNVYRIALTIQVHIYDSDQHRVTTQSFQVPNTSLEAWNQITEWLYHRSPPLAYSATKGLWTDS